MIEKGDRSLDPARQFEAKRNRLGRGGTARHPQKHRRARRGVRGAINLQLVPPFFALPNLRHELQIVNPSAGLLDFVFQLPLEGGLWLVDVFSQVSPTWSRIQIDAGTNTQRKSKHRSA